MGQQTSSLERMAHYLSAARHEEAIAVAHRIQIEEEIAALVPGPEAGQKTVKLSDGRSVTVKRGLNYRADYEAIKRLFDGARNHPPVKYRTTTELDVKGYRWYQDNDPEMFRKISEHVEVRPKKTAVTVKEL